MIQRLEDMMSKKRNPRSGSSLNSLFHEEGNFEAVQNAAVKKVLATKLQQSMEEQSITKTAMAEMLKTSRSQVNRLLDPDNDGVTLQALSSAATVLGMKLEVHLH